jgi:CHAD domain-containing protein
LLAAAARRRATAYAALGTYLQGDEWRRLSLRLAMLPTMQPWRDLGDAEQAELLAAPARDHALRTLDRVHRRVQQAGADLATLTPDELHTARKQAKKLRYATEFYGPLFPNKRVKRFLERLQDLQEALGAVNDGHVAASLMAQLGGGAERAFAAGAVQGYVAARRQKDASRAEKSWTRYLRQQIFWS